MPQECLLLRALDRRVVAIMLKSTGAIMAIELAEPLDTSESSPFSPVKPVNAVVELGQYSDTMHIGCTLKVEWERKTHPLPRSFRKNQK
jgi:hypothetical protein